jgi:hypothetical protein
MAQQLSTFTATVAKVSDRGFKIAEGDWWLNWSRFAGDRTTPPVGVKVNVTVDGREFVQHVEVVQPTPPPAAIATVTTSAPSAPAIEPAAPSAIWNAQDPRGKVILHESVLNSAVAILSSGGRVVDPKDVVALAERLGQWVTR